ncbi:helix-turn-helix domain-containing protein [Oceanobacillus polygoni]|uniref:Transcriptional regulator of aromatic amino acid metabolism n=1 Tax=Oceanobacillus polygoni TaxID=1235259 RepID=A0A9X0YQY9_9BACI|nr:helix-turn-helix domain-containing protein [Oceanobacillus polygoni]MBP2077088.1 transcriptional regulator of aromatic amino acid metabolism [Oceanobacillus polygoni]
MNECIEEVERQLLTLAKEKYQHTTKIAKVLGVNQSTISRKIRNLGVE